MQSTSSCQSNLTKESTKEECCKTSNATVHETSPYTAYVVTRQNGGWVVFFFALNDKNWCSIFYVPWYCIFYFDEEFSAVKTLNFSTLMLYFLPWFCSFHHDVTFSSLMLQFLPKFGIFYLGDIFYLKGCCSSYHDVAFSTLMLQFLP